MARLKIFNTVHGILGLNARNLEFVRPYNLHEARRIADNKLLAKRVLRKAGFLLPKTYKIISSSRILQQFDPGDLPENFVLKPNRGFGGGGILITYKRQKNGSWLDNDLKEIFWRDIKAHIQDILDGRFSDANRPDVAFVEERLVADGMFKRLAFRGVPDIRIIVYNNVPIMAMLRLPTRESHGRANLHMGGMGVGIDIATGITTYAIRYDAILVGADNIFSGIRIPQWDEILELSIKTQQITRLGYLGVDIVLAKNKGPIILEVNARPGLSIQIANLAGLHERLMRVQGLSVDSIERGIRLSKSLFGKEEIAKGIRVVDGEVVKVIETVVLFHKDNMAISVQVKAKIDSGARSSSIDYELARKLGYGDVVEYIKPFCLDNPRTDEETHELAREIQREVKSHPDIKRLNVIRSASGSTLRVTVGLVFKLKNKTVESDVNLISREHLTYDMIIGRRDLKGFLIKPRL